MKGNLNNLSHKYINPIAVDIRIKAITKVGLGITMSIVVVPHITRTSGAEQEIALIIEETMGITCEVIKDIETIIIIEKMVIEVEIMTGTEVGHQIDRLEVGEMIEAQAMVDLGQDQEQVQTDRIRCFECREYDHFSRECPTWRENRETEQIQQMFSLDNDQTLMQTLLIVTEDDVMTITPTETRDSLNL